MSRESTRRGELRCAAAARNRFDTSEGTRGRASSGRPSPSGVARPPPGIWRVRATQTAKSRKPTSGAGFWKLEQKGYRQSGTRLNRMVQS
jgi:hypothetical protein